MKTMDFLAFDMGASNGRGIIGRFDGNRFTTELVGGFENNINPQGDLAFWDLQLMHSSIKQCFQKAKKAGFDPVCFGIDTWGVDFGLLDAQGQVIGAPRSYRAARDSDMLAAFERISRRELFELSGITSYNYNTIFQLYRRVQDNDAQLQQANTLLMMPDLLGYLLTGVKMSEYTIASTSGMLDLDGSAWSKPIVEGLGLPAHLLTGIDRAGSLRGHLLDDVAMELGLGKVAYAAVGCHDTASALAAVPGEGDFAFCSSGTWSLFGMETQRPLLSEAAYQSGFSNEGTVQGGYRPLRNIMGLWLIQECRREWHKEGQRFAWEDIHALSRQAPAFLSIIDPDDAPFFTAGDMQHKIRAYCRRTGQAEPGTVGEFARCIYQSLALKYRWAMQALGQLKGKALDSLNIVGGGIQNVVLNQMVADSLGLPVTVGPIEGAALGNCLMQAMAMGEIKDMSQLKEVLRASIDTTTYLPQETAAWDDAYARLLRYMEEPAQ